MTNSHYGHGDESWWQAMPSHDNTELYYIFESCPPSDDNTELLSDIIESWLQPTPSWLQPMPSDDNTRLSSDIIATTNNTGYLSDIIATATDERGIESHCKGSGHNEKIPWSVEEVLKLIVGVLRTTHEPGQQKRWKEIVGKYFKGERTEEKLKQKWKELKKHATNKTDGEQRLFYMMAAIVEVEIQSDKQEEFENVTQEWRVSSEGIKAWTWLNKVKNMELEQQLDDIKSQVRVAEQSHAFEKMRYRRNPAHP